MIAQYRSPQLVARTGVLGRVKVLRFATTPLRGAPTATWTRPARTGTRSTSIAGQALQSALPSSTTKNFHPADSTLATPVFGPKNGVHLTPTATPTATATDTPTVTPTDTPFVPPSPTVTYTLSPSPTPSVTETPEPASTGDCDGDMVVKVDELVRGVRIALGELAVNECPAFDPDKDGVVTVSELVRAINNALGSLKPSPTPSATPDPGFVF